MVSKPKKLARVQLSGEDGNAFSIIGRCVKAGRQAGYTQKQLDAFRKEATSGDYDNVLATCMTWFEVD